jgi:DNA-binding IclR family transcriptional regulator
MVEHATSARLTHQSLGRGLSALEIVGEINGGAALAEIARATDLPRSTTHYLLQTLVDLGYLRQDPQTRRYHLAARAFQLARRGWSPAEIVEIAMPTLEGLCQLSGESTAVGMFRDGMVTLIAKRDADGPVRVVQDIGAQRPLHCTALGKALAADLTRRALMSTLTRRKLARYTSRTIVQRKQFEHELERVRRQGYATDDEEFAMDIRCVAAPVRDYTGRVIAAISVVGPKHRLPQHRWRRCQNMVIAAARELEGRLGHQSATEKTSG